MSKFLSEKKNKNILGIICIIASAVCFSLMNLFIRLSGEMPVLQKCFFRNIVALIIAVIALARKKQPIVIGEGNLKYLLLRAVGGTVGLMCNFYAIDHMAISDASILNKLSPFFAIIFSAFILKEVADRLEWLSVFIAFAGALLVVKPTFSMEIVPAVAGLIGGCAAGFAYTYVRKLGQRGENSMIIVFFFSAFSSCCILPFMLFSFTPIEPVQWLFLILTGASAAAGQIFITKAYSFAPAKEISVYDFSIVIFSAVWGILFLNQTPDVLSLIGYVIIITTAIIKWWYTIRKNEQEC